jgi:hypothetical protein
MTDADAYSFSVATFAGSNLRFGQQRRRERAPDLWGTPCGEHQKYGC